MSDSKAELKAAKAYHKAQRPLYKKKRVIFPTLLLLLIVIIVVANSGGGSKSTTASAPATTASAPATSAPTAPKSSAPAPKATTKALPAVGTAVRDGKFEFTVVSVKSGVATVGPSGFGETAQGQFVLVDVKVSNVGNQSQSLYDGNQYVYDTSGRKYTANSMAGIEVNGNSSVFLQGINPGNSVEGTLVYDVPKGVTPVSIEFHDSMFSGGVKASL